MILDFLTEGTQGLYWLLTRPLVAYPLGVLFAAFVALRAFYIQKRHERMANQYEALIANLAEIIATNYGLVSRARSATSEEKWQAVEKMLDLQKRLPIYFSDEVQELFDRAQAEHDRGMKTVSENELPAFERSVIEKTHAALIVQAKRDLRPNIVRFTREFFTVFIWG